LRPLNGYLTWEDHDILFSLEMFLEAMGVGGFKKANFQVKPASNSISPRNGNMGYMLKDLKRLPKHF